MDCLGKSFRRSMGSENLLLQGLKLKIRSPIEWLTKREKEPMLLVLLWFISMEFGRAQKGKGNILPIHDGDVSVQVTIIHDLPTKCPWSSQQDMICIRRGNVSPQLILVILANRE